MSTTEREARIPVSVLRALAAAKPTPAACLLLPVLYGYADGDGVAYPSVATLTSDCGFASTRTTQRTLAWLQERGLIHREPGGGRGRTTAYRVCRQPMLAANDTNKPHHTSRGMSHQTPPPEPGFMAETPPAEYRKPRHPSHPNSNHQQNTTTTAATRRPEETEISSQGGGGGGDDSGPPAEQPPHDQELPADVLGRIQATFPAVAQRISPKILAREIGSRGTDAARWLAALAEACADSTVRSPLLVVPARLEAGSVQPATVARADRALRGEPEQSQTLRIMSDAEVQALQRQAEDERRRTVAHLARIRAVQRERGCSMAEAAQLVSEGVMAIESAPTVPPDPPPPAIPAPADPLLAAERKRLARLKASGERAEAALVEGAA